MESPENSITAGYTTDFGGYFRRNDPQDVPHFDAIARRFGLTAEAVVRVDQKHTDKVLAVDTQNAGEGVVRESADEPYDALITDCAGIMLSIITADCVPVFLWDTKKHAIGLVHSGRAGAMQEIACKTVEEMEKRYGCRPQDIRCILGPGLCPEHHPVSVGDEVGFSERFSPEEQRVFLERRGEKIHVDMHAAIRISLLRAGVLAENISADPSCTMENPELCSWRRDHHPHAHILSFMCIRAE